MKRAYSLVMALALVLVATVGSAQTALNHTTLSAAVSSTSANSLQLTSAANITANTNGLVVNGEYMSVTSVNTTTNVVQVSRGNAGTQARTHASGDQVWITVNGSTVGGAGLEGTCTPAQTTKPTFNLSTGELWDCHQGLSRWLKRGDLVNVAEYTVRDSFDVGYLVMQDDGTAKSVTDDEDNFVYGSPLGAIEYREELGKTTSSWVTTASVLDISADNTTTDEGVEILFGVGELDAWFIAGTSGGCIAASIDVADISGTDQVQVGFRDNAAFPDAAAYAGLTIWNSVGINASDGSIVSSQEVSEATDTDDSGVNWADGETRALMVCVDKDGVPTAFYSDAYTHSQTLPDFPLYNAITMTETGSTLTAAQAMVPFISYLADGTDGADVTINWVELTRIP